MKKASLLGLQTAFRRILHRYDGCSQAKYDKQVRKPRVLSVPFAYEISDIWKKNEPGFASRHKMGYQDVRGRVCEVAHVSVPLDDHVLPTKRKLLAQAFRGGARYLPSNVLVRKHNVDGSKAALLL